MSLFTQFLKRLFLPCETEASNSTPMAPETQEPVIPPGYAVGGPAEWFPDVPQIAGLHYNQVAVPKWAQIASIAATTFSTLRQPGPFPPEDSTKRITQVVTRARDDASYRERLVAAFCSKDNDTVRKLVQSCFGEYGEACPTCGRFGGPYPWLEVGSKHEVEL